MPALLAQTARRPGVSGGQQERRQLIKATAFASLAYLGLYGIWYMLNGTASAEELNSGAVTTVVPFFPHGVKLIAAWLLSWRSIPALLPAALVHAGSLWHVFDFSIAEMLVFAIVSASAAYLAFETFRATQLDLYADAGMDIHWRRLLLVGIVASLYNSIGIVLVGDSAMNLENEVVLVLNFVTADLLGLVLVLLGLWVVLKKI